MIIRSRFEGDDHTAAMNMQHAVYYQALGTLITECNRLTRFARAVLNDQTNLEWGEEKRCDHRTLQEAHDILAAAWRFHTCTSQGALPLPEMDSWPVPSSSAWLQWLHTKVSSWTYEAGLVRAVQAILSNPNRDIGYQAEDDLNRGLFMLFQYVPWLDNPISE